ncbi:MAG: hypothetical protein MJ248_00480 [Bacilli bacterium]|nr:hypothetical protein [Bacilli bacterium]
MKKSNLILITLCSFLLVGCNNSGNNTNTGTDTDTNTDTTIPEDNLPDIGERYEGLTEKTSGCSEICEGGTPSSEGFLTEISSDRFLGENTDYECYFDSASTNKTIRVEADHRNTKDGTVHAEIERIEGSNRKFIIHTKVAGDFVLKIYNYNDEIVFRKIVRVRPTYSETEILKVLCNAEYYKTLTAYENYIGKWKCAFYEGDNGVECALTGGDDADRNVKLTASLEYDTYYAPTGCYIFNTTVLTTNTQNTSLVYVTVSAQGDLAYLYYPTTNDKGEMEEHLLTFLYNVDISYVYEY